MVGVPVTMVRRIISVALAAAGMAAVMPAVPLWSGAAARAEVRNVPLASALAGPVPVEIGVGRVALLDVAPHRVVVVSTSDPTVAHAVVRGSDVLLVALRPGVTTVGVGLGGSLAASFRVTVTDQDSGVRAVRLDAGSAAARGSDTPVSKPSGGQPAAQAGGRGAARASDAAGFVSSLSGPQRAALAAYLQDQSLGSLAALLRALSPAQQAEFMRLVSASSDEVARVVGSRPSGAQTAERGQAAPDGSQAPPGGRAAAAGAPAGADVSAPAGVRVTVVPTWTGPMLWLSYVLENHTSAALRADPANMSVSGAAGPVTVRQLDPGDPGVISPGGVETGVIVLAPARGSDVRVSWPLGGGGAAVRVAVRRPAP